MMPQSGGTSFQAAKRRQLVSQGEDIDFGMMIVQTLRDFFPFASGKVQARCCDIRRCTAAWAVPSPSLHPCNQMKRDP